MTLYGLFRTVKITCLRTTNCPICSQFDEIHDVIILEQIFEKCQECMSMYINSCHLKKAKKKKKKKTPLATTMSPPESVQVSHKDIMKPPREKKTKNRMPILRFFGYSICPLGEMIKFRMKRRYNKKRKKIGRVLNNQQLKYHTQMKNRESLFIYFLNILYKNQHSLFLPWGFHLQPNAASSNSVWKLDVFENAVFEC